MTTFAAYQTFLNILHYQQEVSNDHMDFRENLLAKRKENHRIGFERRNLRTAFSKNLADLFPNLISIDNDKVTSSGPALVYGAILDTPERSHASTLRLLPHLEAGQDITFCEMGFLASTHSWAEAIQQKDPTMACLGYVFDDVSQYYMTDYPGRLVERLNSHEDIDSSEQLRARSLINRIREQRISKYNSQPFYRPVVSRHYSRRVLVVDQNFSDASNFYGRADPKAFQKMLDAAIKENPDAEILVKTHPDLIWAKSKKRRGYFDHLESSGRIRVIRDGVNPYQLFDLVDTVYVATSGMGLEALIANKKVVCFGAPFYAGWGLTDDRQTIPHRRRTRSLEELFHIFYIWYTIYALPGGDLPAEIEDVLDFIVENRPVDQLPSELPSDPDVSIIIPAHGVENYIAECLTSVQKQDFQNYEVIVVDDHSPDFSADIVRNYAENDARIILKKTPANLGPGFARNHGLKHARGRYVLFIDPDDFIPDQSHLSKIIEMATADDADMVRFRKCFERLEDEHGNYIRKRRDRTESAFNGELRNKKIWEVPQICHSRHFYNWLYKRDFLEKNNVAFLTTYREERAFLIQCYLSDPTISVSDSNGITYRVRRNSAMRREQTMDDVRDQLENFSQVVRLLNEHNAFSRKSHFERLAQFQVSQFIHYLFFGFAYDTACKLGCETEFATSLKASLDAAGLWSEDLISDPLQLNEKHLEAGTYGLLLTAVRAARPDLLERARHLHPIKATDLWKELLHTPSTLEEAKLQSALSQYARNDRVIASTDCESAPAKRPRIVLHLGASKTGSTALQQLMDRNRAALLRAGIWYPEKGIFWQPGRPRKQAGHSGLLAQIKNSNVEFREYLDAGSAALGDQLHTIILSSEAFFLNEGSFDIPEYLKDYHIEAIVYLRRQDDWANSQYCEFVAGGALNRVQVPFEQWLKEPNTLRWLDYHAFVSKWRELVGPQNLTVKVYERNSLKDGDLIADFSESSGLHQLNSLEPIDEDLGNTSTVSASHVELLRNYNGRSFPTTRAYLSFIEEATTSLRIWREEHGITMPKPYLLTTEEAAALLSSVEEGNRDIAGEILGLDGPLFSTSRHQPPERTLLDPTEVTLVESIYRRSVAQQSSSEEKPRALKGRNSGPSNAKKRQNTVVNLGMFGWRHWLLTPLVRRICIHKGVVLPHEFHRDPAFYLSKHVSQRNRWMLWLLYPGGEALGPGKVLGLWVPLLRRSTRKRGGENAVQSLEDNPVLFARKRSNPAFRFVFRLMFPWGERFS